MKTLIIIVLAITLLACSGCNHYPPITGKVIDSITGKPIEGALVVAQWTKKHGFGLTYHELILITETQTDKEGNFSLTKTPKDRFVEPPEMIIYKEGYIPWRNDMIFPGGTDSLIKNNEWENNVTYKLDMFTNKYKVRQLYDFLDYGMMGGGRVEVPMFNKVKETIPRY
jgi:hypothetical protein